MRDPHSPEDLDKLLAAEIVIDWTDDVSAGRPISRLVEVMKLTAEAHPGHHDEPEHEELVEAMFGAWRWIRDADARATYEDKVEARRYYRIVLGL